MRWTFCKRETQAEAAGFKLEKVDPPIERHRYCLWFNSPTGSKEWYLLNLQDEFDTAIAEAIQLRDSESVGHTVKDEVLGTIREMGPVTAAQLVAACKEQVTTPCSGPMTWHVCEVLNALLQQGAIELYDTCDAFVLKSTTTPILALFGTYYEGDSYLEEQLLALSFDKEKLVAEAPHAKYNDGEVQIFDETLGQVCPNDGGYGDKRNRLIIREMPIL